MKNTFKQNLLIALAVFVVSLPLSAQQFFDSDPFATMILRGQLSQKNPIYTMPTMTGVSEGYVKAAVTGGNAVGYALNYRASSANSYYTIFSRNPAILSKGTPFTLLLNGNSAIKKHCAYISADWDRDGVFETTYPRIGAIGAINQEVETIYQEITIPTDAPIGKTRIRVRYSDAQSEQLDPNGPVVNGLVYDFVVYVVDETPRGYCDVVVFPQTEEWGDAVIETAPNSFGLFSSNTKITVRAIPAGNATFTGWYKNNTLVSTDESYSFKVTEGTALMACFQSESIEPVLEAPVVSTAENPVWYQIKNAHTADARKDRYMVYDLTPSSEFISNLRAQKNADITDKWLWRLQQEGELIKFVHKASGLELTGSGSGDLAMGNQGALFAVTPSGNANGSFSIKYNNEAAKLVNAADQSWKIVFYNAGVGTGSGWYFYRVGTPTSIDNTEARSIQATISDGRIIIRNLEGECQGRIFDQNGRLCMTFPTNAGDMDLEWKSKDGIYILVLIDSKGKIHSFKLSC